MYFYCEYDCAQGGCYQICYQQRYVAGKISLNRKAETSDSHQEECAESNVVG